MSTEKTARQRAAEAGARGKSARPLHNSFRRHNYVRQNEQIGRTRLTARQIRQIRRMARRAAA